MHIQPVSFEEKATLTVIVENWLSERSKIQKPYWEINSRAPVYETLRDVHTIFMALFCRRNSVTWRYEKKTSTVELEIEPVFVFRR